MRTLLAALLVCLAPPALAAQDAPLRPGGAVSGEHGAAGTLAYDLYLDGRTEGDPDAEYLLETRLAEVDGRPAVVRVQVRGSGSKGTYWLRGDTRTRVQFVAADRSMRITLRQGAAGERNATR